MHAYHYSKQALKKIKMPLQNKTLLLPQTLQWFFIIFGGRHIRRASQRISHDTHSSCGRLYYDRNKSGTAGKMVDKKNTSSPTSDCQWWWWYALGRNIITNCHLSELMAYTNSAEVLRTAWENLTLPWRGITSLVLKIWSMSFWSNWFVCYLIPTGRSGHSVLTDGKHP